MGEGRHARFSVSSGGARARAVAFGCDGRLARRDGEPLDATFRLERNVWNGAVEPRLVLRHAQPCAPAAIEVLGEPERLPRGRCWRRARSPRLTAAGSSARRRRADRVLDRRGESPLAVLADARRGGGAVLAVCADVPRRLDGLRARAGGFALISYHALARDPALGRCFRQLVALDPPACAGAGGSA